MKMTKYPELERIADFLAANVAFQINTLTRDVESEMPYKEQYVLETLIKKLQKAV